MSIKPTRFCTPEQPFKPQGRKTLPKNATPSIVATSTDRKIDPAVSAVKAEFRIHTYFINALLEILHNTALTRGKTNLQGTTAPKGWQAGHACLYPATIDNRTGEAIQRIVKAGLSPVKTLPFLEQRISLTPDDVVLINTHHTDEEFISEFITNRLPMDGAHSLLSGTRYNWNCNATFENPDESNQYDSRMEKAISAFLIELQTARLNGTDTVESSTEKLVVWLMDYYQKSIVNLKQREVDLDETSSSFDRMRKFELKHLGCIDIPEDAFNAYLTDLKSFLKSFDTLTEKKTGCPSLKDLNNIRHDFKFLRKIALMASEKSTPIEKIISFYMNSRHLGREMIFDKARFLEKYTFYQEEAEAQMAAVDVFTEPCTIPHLRTALFGIMEAGVRRAPSEDELKQQLFALSLPATPVRAKIKKRFELKVIPYHGIKRAASDTDLPGAPATKKTKFSS